MRATRAYIASLGTTGVLIASSLLLLAIVSALVAFRGWPELEAAEGDAPGMILHEADARVAVAELRVDGDGGELARSGDAAVRRSGERGRGDDARADANGDTGRDGDGGPGESGSSPQSDVRDGGGSTPGGTDVTGLPGVGGGLPDSTDDVREGLSGITQPVQGVTETVGGVNPTLGAPLSNTVDALDDVVGGTVPESGAEPVPGSGVKLP